MALTIYILFCLVSSHKNDGNTPTCNISKLLLAFLDPEMESDILTSTARCTLQHFQHCSHIFGFENVR